MMSGVEFLTKVKELYPDVIRILLTGYTDVNSITESINKGNIYKIFLKPWNDQNIKLEIRQALFQYELIQDNKNLSEVVNEQNEELKHANENLGRLVRERTRDLEVQNQALELSRAILEDLPLPVIGVDADGLIVLLNKEAQTLTFDGSAMKPGSRFLDYFTNAEAKLAAVFDGTKGAQEITWFPMDDLAYQINLTPLRDRFHGMGVVVTLSPAATI